MLALIACLLLILIALALFGAFCWKFGYRRGYSKAQEQCKRILETERQSWDEETRRLRETAAQEIQALSQERERFAMELGRQRMQENQGTYRANIW